MTQDLALEAALRHLASADHALNNACLMERHGLTELAERDLAEALTHEIAALCCDRMAKIYEPKR
jgi:hypothetical protein